MARSEVEGLVILLDVSHTMSTQLSPSTTYLQSCVDIMQMVVQRKMFQSSKDELALILFGTPGTANELWDGTSDFYRHVTVARPLSQVDWKLIDFIQNSISASTLEGNIFDGLVVASNHFHEDANKKKPFKDKRIIVFTDFSSGENEDDKLKELIAGLSKHSIRVDVIHPFSEDDDSDERGQPSTSQDASARDDQSQQRRARKPMSKEQRRVFEMMNELCDKTEGGVFSFEDALQILSVYQSKSVRSAGTKFTLTIGDSFKVPVVSMLKCKENKPEMFRFKKVYAKDESVDIKTDRARFTKDDEQRDLDDKADVIDAYKYGSTYVPIDCDPETLKLKVEKCFSMLGFTKSSNVKRYYYLGDAVHQIMPDPAGGDEVENAFVTMVHSMYAEDVYGLVRKVYNSRSSPEIGCLIPYISKDTTCLFYISLPFEDDLKRFTLENFCISKKFKPTEKQLSLVDELIDSLDLDKKKSGDEDEENEEEDEDDEAYNPHLVFNPYIQRMFQSIALRATNPNADLPDFDQHFTNKYLTKTTEKLKTSQVHELLKRCANEFPLKVINTKKQKKDENNIFDAKKKEEEDNKENVNGQDENVKAENFELDNLLNDAASNANKIRKVGTVNPVDDFRILAEKLLSSDQADLIDQFEDVCLQLQKLIKDFFGESLISMSESDADPYTIRSFQEKAFNCIRVMREYCVKFSHADYFNTYLRAFKAYLVNECRNGKHSSEIESFWQAYFVSYSLTLISDVECDTSTATAQDCQEFLSVLRETKTLASIEITEESKENVEDLLDMM